jgi:7-cyano-7-deazaguanine synthase
MAASVAIAYSPPMAPTEPAAAVVLLSGGVDSSTCLALASAAGYRCRALTIGYGQRNSLELEAAARVAGALGAVEHRVAELSLGWIGASALTDPGIEVPRSVDGETPGGGEGVPVTYVPARNALFLTLGAAWADALGADHLFIGANQIDYSGYPDCRPPFLAALQAALRLGTRREGLTIHAPLMDLSKGEIIRRGVALGLDYGLTWSCYDPSPTGRACGLCDSCVHRRKGFREARIPDPTPYASMIH